MFRDSQQLSQCHSGNCDQLPQGPFFPYDTTLQTRSLALRKSMEGDGDKMWSHPSRVAGLLPGTPGEWFRLLSSEVSLVSEAALSMQVGSCCLPTWEQPQGGGGLPIPGSASLGPIAPSPHALAYARGESNGENSVSSVSSVQLEHERP
jgi:hypothetical protein